MQILDVIQSSFVRSLRGKVGFNCLPVTRRGSGLDTLADACGKHILQGWIPSRRKVQTGLAALLRANHLGTRESFSVNLDLATKLDRTVWPEFFGTKPARLEDSGGFDFGKGTRL